MDLLEKLKKPTAKLDSEGIEYALYGGLAMAICAMPRATLDIDIMIELGTLFRTKRAVEELGFTQETGRQEGADLMPLTYVLVLQRDIKGKLVHVVWGIPKGASSPAVVATACRPDRHCGSDNFLRRKS